MTTLEERLSEARAFLDRRFGPRAAGVVPLGQGFWSRAYAFRLDGRAMVVRFAVDRTDYDKDRSAAAFAGPDLPVPEVVEIGRLDGEGYYAISVHSPGSFFEDLDPASLPWSEPALWRLLDALRELPQQPSAGAGWRGADDDRGRSWCDAMRLPYSPFAPHVADLEERIAAWPEVAEVVGGARRTIGSIVDAGCCPELRHVLHADLVHRNLLVDEGARAVSAVLDWGQTAHGDFVYEIAAMRFYAPWYPVIGALDLPRSAARHFRALGLDVPHLALRLHCYEIRTGLDRILSAAASRWWDLLRPPALRGEGPESIAEIARHTAALLGAGPPAVD